MKSKRKTCLSLLLILLLCLLLFGLYLFFRPDTIDPAANIILDPSSSYWEGPLGEAAQEEQSGIRIPGYSTLHFPADQSTVKMTLYNPEKNDCYFSFSLYLNDETIPLYTSDYVRPGMAIHELELARPLSSGEYTLHIRINTYDPQTMATRNSASVKTELIVE